MVKSGLKYKIGSEDNNVDNVEDDGNDNNDNYSDDDLGSSSLRRKKFHWGLLPIRVISLHKFLK